MKCEVLDKCYIKKHVLLGVQEAIIESDHGKEAALKKMQRSIDERIYQEGCFYVYLENQ